MRPTWTLARAATSATTVIFSIFHVAAKPSETARTTEDEDLEIIESIAKKLRRHPLLPCVGGGPRYEFTDVHSGVRLPLLHCCFQNCSWIPKAGWEQRWYWSDEEKKKVPGHMWEFDVPNYAFDPVAIGPSVDRRMLALLSKLANSDTSKGMICVCVCSNPYILEALDKHAQWRKQFPESFCN